MIDLVWQSAAELARRVKAKEISAVDLSRAYLDRIAALDPKLGTFLRVDKSAAIRRAVEIDGQLAKGEDVGPLAGVPIALKDVLVTEGLATTAASRILGGWIPPYDGTVVARLRAAGAVILGKLNCDEFAMGSSNENSAYKPCKNPWDLTRTPGGSSGGSAAAVAAAFCAASLGTDTGGSIRQPAAMCGVVGVKPTYGRVSRYGVVAFASSLDQVGPLARSVEDAALLLEVISGFDPRDSTSIQEPAPKLRDAHKAGVAGLKIGLPVEYRSDDLDPEIAAAVARAADMLRDAGAAVVDVSLPHTRYALPVYYILAPAEASSNLARYDGVRYGLRKPADALIDVYKTTRGAGFGAEVKRRIMLGTYTLRSGYYDAYYKKAQQVRALIKRDFDAAFASCDAILAPVTPTPAFELGAKSNPIDMYLADVFTLSCNLAGLPGASVPAAMSGKGLPIGVQIMGKPLDEHTVLRVAGHIEANAGVRDHKPAFATQPIGAPA
ncbi:MAG TPA: Asp-tRNA(Asn)/Glu-tRNA(Gln) amidotransferase subunit GatA [Kofleriaceae bacterium]|nr:Asp-tRNA(Asn)/Glu-tRNA(Gln) amidotransferase subunit GatA [Kofleriaceae bacterium]